jgi:hypothetical protein
MGNKIYNYLFIDDEVKQSDALVRQLEQLKTIKITVREPEQFEITLEKDFNFDGIIMDYRLDGGKKVKYRGLALAQELRNKITEGEIKKDLPIILCSTDDKIKRLKMDETGNDLFDHRFLKDVDLNIKAQAQKLASLAAGYIELTENQTDLSKIIGRDIAEIDGRVFAKFRLGQERPVHELARHLLHQVIQPNGILLESDVVAARLGIDKKKTKDYDKLMATVFDDCAYKGVFSLGWTRWWRDKINEKFEMITHKTLAAQNATQSVALLKDYLKKQDINIDIKEAKSLKLAHSNRFWTICEATRKPLDPLEGYKIAKEPTASWQDYSYVSLYAVLEGKLGALEIHPEAKNRLEFDRAQH